MKRLLRYGPLALALSIFVTAARADEKDQGKTDPPGAPVELKIVAKKATYTLDLGGLTAADFRKALKDAAQTGKYPAPPAVDLELELKNTSDKDIQVWTSGDPVVINLDLKGPGAESVAARRAFTTDFRLPKAVTLGAGKTQTFPLKSLSYGFRGVANQAYWIEAGEYTLTASVKTGVSPVPKGAKDNGEGFGQVTVTSAPVKIKVEGK